MRDEAGRLDRNREAGAIGMAHVFFIKNQNNLAPVFRVETRDFERFKRSSPVRRTTSQAGAPFSRTKY